MQGISDFRVGEVRVGLERIISNRSPQVNEHFDDCPSSIPRRLLGKGHAIGKDIGRQGDKSITTPMNQHLLLSEHF